MILVIGAKGGVGTTLVAAEIARGSAAIALDLADGMLAAKLERLTWPLAALVFATPTQRRRLIETVIEQRHTLVWSPECMVSVDTAWSVLRDIDIRRPVVIDGGLAPADEALREADAILIVSADNDVARWHEQQWLKRCPRVSIISGTKEAARAWTAQPIPTRTGVNQSCAK